jgi:hypothetical protein
MCTNAAAWLPACTDYVFFLPEIYGVMVCVFVVGFFFSVKFEIYEVIFMPPYR